MLGLGTAINRGEFVSAGEPLFLDTYPGATAAYSLRQLSASYSGPLIRIRRDGDNAEIDVKASSGVVDSAAIAAHCGSFDGSVVTIYDQSGNSRDATAINTAYQPKIYDGSTGVVTEGSRLAMESIQDAFEATPFAVSQLYAIHVGNLTFANATGLFGAYNVYNDFVGWTGVGWRFRPFVSDFVGTKPVGQSSIHLYSTLTNGSAAYVNNVLNGSTGNSNPSETMTIKALNGIESGVWPGVGKLQEIIIYDGDQTANRLEMERDINAFYDIYT